MSFFYLILTPQMLKVDNLMSAFYYTCAIDENFFESGRFIYV